MNYDFIVLGFPINKIDFDNPFNYLIGNRTSVYGIAHNLCLKGYRVAIVKDIACEIINEEHKDKNLSLILYEDVFKYLKTTKHIIMTATSLSTLIGYYPSICTIKHPSIYVRFCFTNNYTAEQINFIKSFKYLTFNNNIHKEIFKKLKLRVPCSTIPYSVNYTEEDFKYIKEDASNNVFYAGVIRRPEQIKKLIQFSIANSECTLNIISSLIFDQSIPKGEYGSLQNPYLEQKGNDIEIEKFNKIVKKICECEVPNNIRYLGEYRDKDKELLGKCSMALSFSREKGQLHDDSKILMYLGLGCPVLTDRENPAFRFVKETKHGIVVPYEMTDEDMKKAYLICKSKSKLNKKLKVAKYIQKYNWEQLTDTILKNIKKTKRVFFKHY